MKITWDETKKFSNQTKHGVSFEEASDQTKHGVSFEEASELFSSGADFLEIFDEAHSHDEARFFAIGPIRRGVVLIVWTELLSVHGEGDSVRIISARWATRRERDHYRSSME